MLSSAIYLLLIISEVVHNYKLLEDIGSTTKPVIYKFDYNLFKNKTNRLETQQRLRRAISNRFLQEAQIENIEVKFSWSDLVRGSRLGSTFILRKGNKYIEYAMLYSPRDNSFTVRGLMDATGYIGEVRIIRSKEALSNVSMTDETDTGIIKLDTARIVTGSETRPMLDVLANLPESPIKLESVSISLKLPRQRENIVLEVTDLSNKNAGKAVVHVVPDTVSLVVNDLPPQTIVKIIVRRVAGSASKELSSLNLFTGSVTVLKLPKISSAVQSTIPRVVFARPSSTPPRRTTVTCYVDRKPPFQGFPCKGSSVCIPLHWECDGEDDCQGGFDEKGCQNGLSLFSQQNSQSRIPIVNNNNNQQQGSGQNHQGSIETMQKCRNNEFDCFSRGVSICLPISWMCDGRMDCTDGWDEHRDNCRDNPEQPSFGINPSGNHNYHNYNYRPSYCGWNHFKCRKGGCTPLRTVCDGHRDCKDGSDEYDCPDDEDEDEDFEFNEHCDLEHEFICSKRRRSRRCVPRPWVCDDQDDCPFGEDEDEDICRHRYHN